MGTFLIFAEGPGRRAENEECPHFSSALNLFARVTSGATLLLIFAGGLVTSTGSGLAVPDWPLSFGQLFPPMVGGVFYEHGHRMVAATVGILTLALAIWMAAAESRTWVRALAWAAVGAILLQAALGGITVLYLLPTPVSVTHACLGQTFFGLTVVLAMVTGRSWTSLEPETIADRAHPSLRSLTLFTAALAYLQLVLGAVMRHTGAGLAIPDFPLAFGRVIPEFTSSAVAIHFSHRAGALAITASVAWTTARILGAHRTEARLARPAVALLALVVLQVGLGAFTVWSAKAVFPSTAHVAAGAAVLATSLVLAIRVHVLCARRLAAPLVPKRAAA